MQWVVTFVSNILNNLFLSPSATGLENLKKLAELKTGHGVSVVFIMNHTNANDPFVATAFLPAEAKRALFPIVFPTKQEWFTRKWKRRMVKILGCIPIGDGDIGSVKEIIRRIKHHETIFLFPEGMVSLDGQVNEDLRLLEVMSKFCPLIVQPIRTEGLRYFWDFKGMFLCKRKLRIGFGEPLLLQKCSHIDAMKAITSIHINP